MPAPHRASKLVHKRIAVLPSTDKKLAPVARSLGLRYNPIGRLLDICVDMIEVTALSLNPSKQRGYGRLLPDAVRAIRKSREKIMCIAMEHEVSEAMVIKIRARECYKWVR